MKTQYIKAARVRAMAKQSGKRVSNSYIMMLDSYISRKVNDAIGTHNGGKKTIDENVGAYTL